MKKSIITLSLVFYLLFPCVGKTNNNVPKIQNGILDLRELNLATEGPIKLNGQWKFFWEEFVLPDKINDRKDYSLIKVPDFWNNQKINNKKIPLFGYGTYYLKILNKSNNKPLALKINKIFSAYKCYINNKLLKSVGKIAKSKNSMSATVQSAMLIFNQEKEEVNIVIHVSNFHYKMGGIKHEILFGEPGDIIKSKENAQKLELFVFGIFIIVFFYHLVLYALRPESKETLIFALLCLFWGIRVITLGELVLMDFFPSINIDWYFTIEYLTFYLIILLFNYFIQIYFPEEYNKKILFIVILICSFYTVLTIFTSSNIFTMFLPFFQLVVLLLIAYKIFVVVLALFRKREGALALFVGIMSSLIVTINDILYTNSIIKTGNFFYYGVLILVFSQSYMIASSFSRAYSTVKHLTADLKSKNKELQDFALHLEEKIENRTRELVTANEEMAALNQSLIHTKEELEAANSETIAINEDLIRTRDNLWSEMQLAKKIQTVLLPKYPVIEGFEILPFMNPADDVGGDYYDIINYEGYNWLIIGDVSGHGVSAGLIMMMVQTAIHTILDLFPDYDPSKLIVAINKTIKKNLARLDEEKYMSITVFAAFKEGKFTFAGLHQNILIYREKTGNVDIIETDGLWIGMMDNIQPFISNSELNIEIGDIMLLFTDGITEAWKKGSIPNHRDSRIDMYGEETLIKIFHKHSASKNLNKIKTSLLESLNEYDYDDDITLVLVKRVK